MKRYITAAFLVSGALLLGGCTESITSAPETSVNSSLGLSSNESSESQRISDSTSASLNDTGSEKSSYNDSESTSNISSSENSFEQSSNVSVKPVPVEFTEEDRELQEILKTLIYQAAGKVNMWFYSPCPLEMDTPVKITLDGKNALSEIDFYPITVDYIESTETICVPNSVSEFESVLMEYFTKWATEKYMQLVAKGNLVRLPDGQIAIKLDSTLDINPIFIEAGGRMYRNTGDMGGGLAISYETAKVISKTDKTIEFSYLRGYYGDDEHYFRNGETYFDVAWNGLLKFERGGWKLDYFGYMNEWGTI